MNPLRYKAVEQKRSPRRGGWRYGDWVSTLAGCRFSHRDSGAHFPRRFLAEASPDSPSAGQFHVEAGQRFRQTFDAIKHTPALAEDLADVFVGVGIEAETEGGDALGG